MFTVELYGRIRRAVMIEGLSRREAAQRFGVHRNTIAKMLLYAVPPGYRRRERPVSKKLQAHTAWIDGMRVNRPQQTQLVATYKLDLNRAHIWCWRR